MNKTALLRASGGETSVPEPQPRKPRVSHPKLAEQPHLQRQLLTPKEACAVLGVGMTTLYRLMGEGQLAFLKIGKCTKLTTKAIEDFLERVSKTSTHLNPVSRKR